MPQEPNVSHTIQPKIISKLLHMEIKDLKLGNLIASLLKADKKPVDKLYQVLCSLALNQEKLINQHQLSDAEYDKLIDYYLKPMLADVFQFLSDNDNEAFLKAIQNHQDNLDWRIKHEPKLQAAAITLYTLCAICYITSVVSAIILSAAMIGLPFPLIPLAIVLSGLLLSLMAVGVDTHIPPVYLKNTGDRNRLFDTLNKLVEPENEPVVSSETSHTEDDLSSEDISQPEHPDSKENKNTCPPLSETSVFSTLNQKENTSSERLDIGFSDVGGKDPSSAFPTGF